MSSKNKAPIGALTVTQVDGQSYEVPILPPGAAVRFAVGTPDAHGMVRRLWSSPNTTDFYLSIRDQFNGGDVKYSFHASGDWRLQYEQSKASTLGVHRVIDRWERPAPGPHGGILVARIMVPSDDIVPTGKSEPDAEKIIWVPPGPPSSVNVIVIMLIPVGRPFSPPANAYPIAAMNIADGSLIVVLRAVGPMTIVEEDAFSRLRDQARLNPPPGASSPHIPRSDPEYRCEGIMRSAHGDHDFVIADLLM